MKAPDRRQNVSSLARKMKSNEKYIIFHGLIQESIITCVIPKAEQWEMKGDMFYTWRI